MHFPEVTVICLNKSVNSEESCLGGLSTTQLKTKHNFLDIVVDQRERFQRTAQATMLTFICTIEAQITEVMFRPPNFSCLVIHSFSAKVEE